MIKVTVVLADEKERVFFQRMVEDAWLANLVDKRNDDEEYLTFLSRFNSGMVGGLRLFKEMNDEAPKPESFRVSETGSAGS